MEVKLAIPENVLYQALKDGMKEIFAPMVPQITEKLNALLPEAEPVEIATSGVRKMLTAKGYRVQSHIALMNVLNAHNIKGRIKGKELWFPYAEVKRIATK